MRRFLAYAIALTLTVPAAAQLYVEPEKNVECEVFLTKEFEGSAHQGMEIHGKYIFALYDGGHVNVFDFTRPERPALAGFELASSRRDNHANCANFGVETKRGASFPLLYVSNGLVGGDIEWTCFVESITRRGKRFSSEIAQTITLDTRDWEKDGYVQIYGAPCWMIDRERQALWIFSARQRTTPKITKHNWENQYIATRFRIPKLSEGESVTLSSNDILDQVVLPFDVGFTQSGTVHDGLIYYCFGTGAKDKPSAIRIYDTDSRTITARYDLQKQIPIELESLAVVDGFIYANSNINPKKDTGYKPVIWKISLPKPEAEAATPLDEIRQNPEKAGGIYYVPKESLSDGLDGSSDDGLKEGRAAGKSDGAVMGEGQKAGIPQPPTGYKPFYINGYFRHGARQVDDNVTYNAIWETLGTAAKEDNLTDFGKAIWKRLEPFRSHIEYREGDLTQRGYRQALALGRRTAENYPEVFEDEPYLKANATNVLRVAATMQAFAQGVNSINPGLRWAEIDNSRAFLPAIHPYGKQCPGREQIDADIVSGKGVWDSKYEAFRDSKIDSETFLKRLFKDTSKISHDGNDLEWRFFLMASAMQCLDRQVPLWDLFTEEEILAWAEIENYKYYAQKGPEPVNIGRGSGLGSRTLRHILEESAGDIALGRHGLDLNFGHDGTLMAVLANIGAGTWAESTGDPAEAIRYWQFWNIPMGANLQLVFYRNADNDILVRMMLNEKDLTLPLKAVQGSFYRWDEVYDHYMKHCDGVEKELKISINN